MAVNYEVLIKQHLFTNKSYDTSVRPQNATVPVVVKMGLAVRQVIDLDERNQILFSSLWYRWVSQLNPKAN